MQNAKKLKVKFDLQSLTLETLWKPINENKSLIENQCIEQKGTEKTNILSLGSKNIRIEFGGLNSSNFSFLFRSQAVIELYSQPQPFVALKVLSLHLLSNSIYGTPAAFGTPFNITGLELYLFQSE